MDIGDTFQLFFGNIRYQYFCQQAAPLRLLHYDDRGTTSQPGVCPHARTVYVQGDVNYMGWTHVLGSVCCADEKIGVKTLTANAETFHLKPDHQLHTVQLTLRALALRVIAHPLLTQLRPNYCPQLSTATH